MHLKQSPTLDTKALTVDHEDTSDLVARDAPSAKATAAPTPAGNEPSSSERLYEAYRLWAFTGR